RLALLHPVPLRPGVREMGNGEGSGVSHRRLITQLLRTLRHPPACERTPSLPQWYRGRRPGQSRKSLMWQIALDEVLLTVLVGLCRMGCAWRMLPKDFPP